MQEGNFICVNCQMHFSEEASYKSHYKSEHHRYNVKRKLISLPPLSLHEYTLQFQTEMSSKSQSNSQIYCEVCSKKFMSAQTYKQHINSNKHKTNRKSLLKNKSQSSSLSEFELIEQKCGQQEICLFCPAKLTQSHLAKEHCFPPFKNDCVDLIGLLNKVASQVKTGKCVFCSTQFSCSQSAKQHMNDLGHAKLDLQNFGPYQLFYLWKINESSEEDEPETAEILQAQRENSEFSLLQQQTLESLEAKRQARIQYGLTGVTINGKQVGYRAYKQFYKQYLSREIQSGPRQQLKALTNQSWVNAKALMQKPQFQRIQTRNNHR